MQPYLRKETDTPRKGQVLAIMLAMERAEKNRNATVPIYQVSETRRHRQRKCNPSAVMYQTVETSAEYHAHYFVSKRVSKRVLYENQYPSGAPNLYDYHNDADLYRNEHHNEPQNIGYNNSGMSKGTEISVNTESKKKVLYTFDKCIVLCIFCLYQIHTECRTKSKRTAKTKYNSRFWC